MPSPAGVQFKLVEVVMKLKVQTTIFLLIACHVSNGRAQPAQVPCCDENGRLIVHIEHDGLIFSVNMDATDDRFLLITIPRKDGTFDLSSLPPVHLRVLTVEKARKVGNIVMRDTDPPIEGQAEVIPGWISNGGWTEIRYRFALQKYTVIDDIQSVTISIGDQTYTAFPY